MKTNTPDLSRKIAIFGAIAALLAVFGVLNLRHRKPASDANVPAVAAEAQQPVPHELVSTASTSVRTNPNTVVVPRSGGGTTGAGSTATASATSPAEAAEAEAEATELSRWKFGTMWGREKTPELAAFSSWTKAYLEATTDEQRESLAGKGRQLAQDRKSALKSLIESDPQSALAVTVPVAVRDRLPASVADLLEERVSGRGDLNVLAVTLLAGENSGVRPIQRQVVVAGRTFEAHTYGRREQTRTTPNISVHGIAVDGVLALSESPVRLLEPGEAVDPKSPIQDNRCPVSKRDAADSGLIATAGPTTYRICTAAHVARLEGQVLADETNVVAAAYQNLGSKRVLMMLVDFPDRIGAPVSAATAQTRMNDVAAFLRANSFNQIDLSQIAVTPVLRMPAAGSQYSGNNDYTGLLEAARTAAAAAGFPRANYQFDVVVMASIGFGWSGLGYVGGKGAWVQGSLPAGTLAHELGHNIGLWHAGYWNSSTGIGNGSREEYGNIFDVMGNSGSFPNGHFNANLKYNVNWLTDANIHRVSGPGTYRIHAMDAGGALRSDRRYALRIPAAVPILGLSLDYWVDYRMALSANNLGSDGAVVQWGNDLGAANASLLIDTTPGSGAGKSDSPITSGSTFTDAARNLAFTVTARGGSGVDSYVDVRVGAPAPPISLADALDLPSVTWTTGGIALWTGQNATTHDGVDAGASGGIGHNQETWMQTTITGPGTVGFWWKVSSEGNYDFLRVQVDGTDAAAISGEVNWQPRTVTIGNGAHAIRWRYAKDGSVNSGQDRAWVDQVTFTAGPVQPSLYVDWRFTGANSDGSLTRPFRTVAQGYAAVSAPTTLKIRSGNYLVDFLVNKPVLLEPYDGNVLLGGSVGNGFTPSGDAGSDTPAPTLGAPRIQIDGTFAFPFTGVLGQRYQVHTTTNLVTWEMWKEFTAESDTFDIVDDESAVTPHRFFKVVVP